MRIGDNELELLKFLQDQGRATVRELLEGYGEPRGLARTTVQTMIERLCKKGFVGRIQLEGGGIAYVPQQDKGTTIRDAIDNFVKTTLDDSIQPIASYLANSNRITPEEIEMLKDMIREIEEKQQ